MAPAALLLQAIDDIGQGKVDELSLRGVNIGDAGAQTLCHALRGNASITSLDLYDALLGEEGCLAVVQALHEHVRCASLDLGGNRITPKAAAALAPLLKAQRPDGTPRDVCAEETSALSEVRALRLASCGLTADACAALLSAAGGELALTTLALPFNAGLGDDPGSGGEALADGVRRAPALGSLTAQGCALGPLGGAALAAALPNAHALRHLDLSANALGDDGGRAVAHVLPFCGLEELLLGSNGLGDRAATSLAHALTRRRRCALRTLSLRANRIRDGGAAALAEALGAPRPSGNRSLTSLDLGHNKLGQPGVLALGDALVANGAVRHLELGGNARADADALRAIGTLVAHNRREGTRDGERGVSAALIEPNAAASELVRVRVQQLYTNAYDVAEGVEDDAAAAGGGARPGAVVAARLAARDAEREKVAAALRSTQMALERAALDVGALRSKEAALDTTLRKLLV